MGAYKKETGLLLEQPCGKWEVHPKLDFCQMDDRKRLRIREFKILVCYVLINIYWIKPN